MRYLVLLIFFEVIEFIQASKSRSVNLALETVLQFDSKDDIDFIDTLQNFLKKLKTTISKHRFNNFETYNYIDHVERNDDFAKPFIFTDFLAETISVLKSYNDNDLKKFFRSLDRELKTWQSRKEFNELTDKLGFRRLIDRNLETLKKFPVDEIRRKLSSLSEKLNFNHVKANNGFVSDVLTYFYKKESETKLLNFLDNLKLYRSPSRRRNIDLKNIIRNGILTIIDPFLKLNSSALKDLNSMLDNYMANSSDTKQSDKSLNKNRKNTVSIQKISRQKTTFLKVLKQNKVLDYLEDQKRVIEEYFTTALKKAKFKPRSKEIKTLSTAYKKITTQQYKKSNKFKTKQSRFDRVIIIHDKNSQKHARVKNSRNEEDNKKDEKPVLIKLGSSGDSELKSVEQYVFSSPKRPLNQKRNMKSPTPKLTTKKRNVLRTTKKSRKAFRTTTLSAEGLSIEHFGSLFGREFHRKSNDNDTFIQPILNSSTSALPYNLTLTKDETKIFSKEMRRKDNLSNVEEYNSYDHETKNVSSDENTNVMKTVTQNNIITEFINIKGNIVIENLTKDTEIRDAEVTTSNPLVDFTTNRNFNVSIVTKYFNLKPIKPSIILRSQDIDLSNETYISTPKISTIVQTTLNAAQTTNVDAISSKNTKDGLENEIEGIMNKYNASTIPVEFKKFVKEIQNNVGDNKKVKDQINADFAKLLAPPTTKSTVTELFTDPFDDIDNADDIM